MYLPIINVLVREVLLTFNSSPQFSNCIFYNNSTSGSSGGAVSTSTSSNTYYNNCVFVGNAAKSTFGTGGAVSNSGGSHTFINCTFWGNYVVAGATAGGAFYSSTGTTVAATNCIFYQNKYSTSTSTGSGSDMANNGTATFTNCITQAFGTDGVNGNKVGVNPLFVSTTNLLGADNEWATADDGLQLTSCSPAVDAGTNTGVAATDITGSNRIYNTITDMGAYEYTGGTASAGISLAISASATTITAGTSVTFTATPTGASSTITYQWKKNGSNIGTNSATYTDAALNNNDSIYCVLTTTNSCSATVSVNSNGIKITVSLPAASSLNFDGTNDYVSLPTASIVPQLTTGQVTISAWINMTSRPNYA